MKLLPLHAVVAALLCAPLLLAAPAGAAVGDDRTPLNLAPAEPARSAAAGGGSIARVVVGLAVVIGVIYGLAWVLRQLRAAREGQATGAGLAALSSLPLGPNRSVHLVRVGHELVLLGVGEKGVTPIRTYAEHEARAAGLLAPDQPALPAGPTGPTGAALVPIAAGAGTLVATLRKRTVRR